MKSTLHVLGAAALLAAGGTMAGAADIGVTGLKLIIVDKTATGSAKAVFVAKDTAITKGAGAGPGVIFSELGIAYDATSGLFSMPNGAGWLVNKETVAKYVNNDAPTGSAVKVSVLKPASLIKVVGKSLGDTPIDISTAPTGDVYASHSIFNGGEAFRHCTRFGTCSHKVIAGGTGYKLVCKGDSSGDAGCLGAPPPACCNLSDPVTMCAWTPTALTCTFAGGTPGAAGSSCDAVSGTCAVAPAAGACCGNVASPFGDLCLGGPALTAELCGGTFTGSGVCMPDGNCS